MTTAEQTTSSKSGLSSTAVFYLIALVIVALFALNTLLFGLPGLAMTALAAVPVIYGILMLITVGK